MDAVYGYQSVNVEAQMASSSSLLHWTKRMIEIRRQNPAFGLGTFQELGSTNPSVLAFIRELPAAEAPRGSGAEDDLVLCVMNLSRFPQPTELDLRAYQAIEPVELIGGVHFPKIGELPYLLTLGGHGFYWFKLQRP